MMKPEYGTVPEKVLNRVSEKWKKRPIRFEVVGCKSWFHEDRYGRKVWIICLNVDSLDIHELRLDLGLNYSEIFNPHITILEYVE